VFSDSKWFDVSSNCVAYREHGLDRFGGVEFVGAGEHVVTFSADCEAPVAPVGSPLTREAASV
jgi:hypothetical protein